MMWCMTASCQVGWRAAALHRPLTHRPTYPCQHHCYQAHCSRRATQQTATAAAALPCAGLPGKPHSPSPHCSLPLPAAELLLQGAALLLVSSITPGQERFSHSIATNLLWQVAGWEQAGRGQELAASLLRLTGETQEGQGGDYYPRSSGGAAAAEAAAAAAAAGSSGWLAPEPVLTLQQLRLHLLLSRQQAAARLAQSDSLPPEERSALLGQAEGDCRAVLEAAGGSHPMLLECLTQVLLQARRAG